MIGLYLDEIEIGRRVVLGSYTFTEDNINRFRQQFAPVPMHMSDDAAATGLFGQRVAVGFHICCGWMNCFIATNTAERVRLANAGKVLPEIGPSPGLEKLRWPNPVVVGDIIDYDVTVVAKRQLNSKPEWGIVSAVSTGWNQQGVQVLAVDSKILVAARIIPA
jgi:acyl dehydratase